MESLGFKDKNKMVRFYCCSVYADITFLLNSSIPFLFFSSYDASGHHIQKLFKIDFVPFYVFDNLVNLFDEYYEKEKKKKGDR